MSLVMYHNRLTSEAAYYAHLRGDSLFQKQIESNRHAEVMESIKELGKKQLSVTVLASDLAPAVERAYAAVVPAAKDYARELQKFSERYHSVRTRWQERKRRIKAKKIKQLQAELAEKEKRQKEAMIEQRMKCYQWHWLWPMKRNRDDVEREVTMEIMANHPYRPYDLDYVFQSSEDAYLSMRGGIAYHRSAPVRPWGVDDAEDIEELADTVRALPGAHLTIPVETVQMIAKYAGEKE